MEVAVPVEQGVVLALTKSHHQGPFLFAPVTSDQRCHNVARGVFWGSFSHVLGMHCFPGFPLKGGIEGGLKGGHEGRTVRADIKGPSALLLANATSRTVINQPQVPSSRLATRTRAVPL